jgi:hypothetical protein
MSGEGRTDTRQLPAQALDGVLVIREKPSFWTLLFILLFGAIEYSHQGPPTIVSASLWILLVAALLGEVLFYPPWVLVGSTGVTVRHHGRRAQYPWREVARFEIGNPAIPSNAYLVPKEAHPKGVVELPRFSLMTPLELVSLLEGKRRLYGTPQLGAEER